MKGGAKGATIGIGISVPAAYVLHQRWPAFRQLPLPLKAFFITGFTVATGVIAADKSGLAYEVCGSGGICTFFLLLLTSSTLTSMSTTLMKVHRE